MTTNLARSVVATLILGGLASLSYSAEESLAEVAEREKARRRTSPGGTSYSESDLRKGATPEPSPTAKPQTAKGWGEGGSKPSAASEEGRAGERKEDPISSEGSTADRRKAWETRAAEKRREVEAADIRVKDLEATIAGKKSLIRPDYQRMLADPDLPDLEKNLAEAKTKAEEARTALAQFQEDARRQGIPPGWLEP